MVNLSPEVLAILACPSCHTGLALDYEAAELVCTSPECGVAYPVVEGIPVLLVDQARRPQQS